MISRDSDGSALPPQEQSRPNSRLAGKQRSGRTWRVSIAVEVFADTPPGSTTTLQRLRRALRNRGTSSGRLCLRSARRSGGRAMAVDLGRIRHRIRVASDHPGTRRVAPKSRGSWRARTVAVDDRHWTHRAHCPGSHGKEIHLCRLAGHEHRRRHARAGGASTGNGRRRPSLGVGRTTTCRRPGLALRELPRHPSSESNVRQRVNAVKQPPRGRNLSTRMRHRWLRWLVRPGAPPRVG